MHACVRYLELEVSEFRYGHMVLLLLLIFWYHGNTVWAMDHGRFLGPS